jgi:hypothetical protein
VYYIIKPRLLEEEIDVIVMQCNVFKIYMLQLKHMVRYILHVRCRCHQACNCNACTCSKSMILAEVCYCNSLHCGLRNTIKKITEALLQANKKVNGLTVNVERTMYVFMFRHQNAEQIHDLMKICQI